MQLVITKGSIREQFQELYPAYRRRFSRLILAIADFINSHGWVTFALVSLLCGAMRFGGMATRHLDHDELYTYYIAQAPSLAKLLTLTRTVDLHPPMSYLLVRLSFALFGLSAWSCRVPSAIAFVLATLFIFRFLKGLFPPIYGLIAVLFLWSGPYSYNALIARPYSLLLGFTCLSLVCWNQTTEKGTRGRWALLGLAVGGFGMLLSHVLGVLPFAALVAAELLRLWYLRKPDWRLLLALLAPLVSLITYIPLFHHHSKLLFTPAYRPTLVKVLSCYWDPLRFVGAPLLLIVILALVKPLARKKPEGEWSPPPLNRPLILFLFGLFLVPVAVAVLFSRSGTAFFDRYGVVMLIPAAIVPPMFLAYRTRCHRSYAAIVAVLFTILIYFNTFGKVWLLEQLSSITPPAVSARVLYLVALPPLDDRPKLSPMPAYLSQASVTAPAISQLNAVQPSLDLVAGTALTFMELDHVEDVELVNRLFLLTNRDAAATITHDTVFENYEQLKEVFPIRGTVQSYCSFILGHPRFLVLGSYNHPQGWLLRKLEIDGAQLKILGTYTKTYDEHEVYEVTVPASACRTSR
jgi:4-amino-4-deoxy-L-arabinose transferase-like glycosyltransferase